MPNRAELEREMTSLLLEGQLLLAAMAREVGALPSEQHEYYLYNQIELPNVRTTYDSWYSIALRVVGQILPDRFDDFVLQYKNDHRKQVTRLTYTISDFLLGYVRIQGERAATPTTLVTVKMQRQLAILKAAQRVFQSKLDEIGEVLQAEMFDSELAAAAELSKAGFVRGAGAIAGVVLERHLFHVCEINRIGGQKKLPTINDLNQQLKNAEHLDTGQWRFIQHLGDLRNLCDHRGEREPTKGDVSELIEGVDKVIKTVN